jgi:hypothetical protein
MPDDAVDELYAAPFDEFVTRRDALAKQLRADGDRDAASEVKQLRKPSRAAWAVNQAVRRAPDRFDEVLQTGTALKNVQQKALREGHGTGLNEAVKARQAAVRALADVAVEVLGATGESARDAVEQTLMAASIDPGAADAVSAARLTQELEPPDIFSTLELGPTTPAARSRGRAKAGATASKRTATREAPKAAPAAKPDRAALRKAERAEAAAVESRQLADEAEQEHEDAQEEADRLVQAARDAAAAADAARNRARQAATQAREARKHAQRAEQEARVARAAAGEDR